MKQLNETIGKPFYHEGNEIDIMAGTYRVKYIDDLTGYPFLETWIDYEKKWVDTGWFWPEQVTSKFPT